MSIENRGISEGFVSRCEICHKSHTGPCRKDKENIKKIEKILTEPVCGICKGLHSTSKCPQEFQKINPICEICGEGHKTSACIQNKNNKNKIEKEY